MIDLPSQVSLGNDNEMKAFYVPELTLNARRVSECEGDPSDVMSRLMKAATRAQTVCGTIVTGWPHPYMSFAASFLNLCGNGVWSGSE